jgi:anti-sigma B factor antagonist
MNRIVSVSHHGNGPIVKIYGELCGSRAQVIAHRLERICALKTQRLIVDLSDIGFVDSHGLGVLIHVWKSLREQKRELLLLKPRGFMKRMFEGTNLTQIFTIIDSLEAA